MNWVALIWSFTLGMVLQQAITEVFVLEPIYAAFKDLTVVINQLLGVCK